jgi:hypothetical protein
MAVSEAALAVRDAHGDLVGRKVSDATAAHPVFVVLIRVWRSGEASRIL